jgi:hypothetical protein
LASAGEVISEFVADPTGRPVLMESLSSAGPTASWQATTLWADVPL